jgi:hypothetical protein
MGVWALILFVTLFRGVILYGGRHSTGMYPMLEQTGRNWATGQPLYSRLPGLTVFRYSPLAAALMSPLSMIPNPIGSGIIRLLNVGGFLCGLWWWGRAVVPELLDAEQLGALFLAAVPLAFQELGDVQTNGLAVGLMLLGTAAIARFRPTLGMIFLVLATMIKAYPVALLLLLILLFPRQLFWRFLIITGAALALPFALQSPSYVPQQYRDWFAFGLNARGNAPGSHQLLDIRVLFEQFHLAMTAHQYFLLELVAAVLVATLVIHAKLRGMERKTLILLTFGLATCWMTVFGPATESQTYIVVAPIMAWALIACRMKWISPILSWVIIPTYILFAMTQFSWWLSFSQRFHDYGPHAAAGLLLMGTLIGLILQQRRLGPSVPTGQFPT